MSPDEKCLYYRKNEMCMFKTNKACPYFRNRQCQICGNLKGMKAAKSTYGSKRGENDQIQFNRRMEGTSFIP